MPRGGRCKLPVRFATGTWRYVEGLRVGRLNKDEQPIVALCRNQVYQRSAEHVEKPTSCSLQKGPLVRVELSPGQSIGHHILLSGYLRDL